MASDIYASIKELTHPKSGGKPINPHAVSARAKNEPDFERMRELTRDRSKSRDAVAA